MTPYLADADVTLYHGDVLDVLRGMEAESVDCVVTSPPYWGLRDYGNEGQIGLEETPEQYVDALVAVFAEVRRVLAPHGTVWCNLGDSHQDKQLVGVPWRVALALQADGWWLRSDIVWAKPNPMPESVTDRPTKSHEYVFLLTKASRYFFDQEAVREPAEHPPFNGFRGGGGYVNQNAGASNSDKSGANTSVRPITAPPQDETLDGSDGEAPRGPDGRRATSVKGGVGSIQHRDGERWPNAGRNVRSVWTIATQPFAAAHFATYPEELVRRCVLAGCAERVCVTCGEPSVRIVEHPGNPAGILGRQGEPNIVSTRRQEKRLAAGHTATQYSKGVAVGWSDCGHNNWRPGRVLDPFVGSGTSCKVARDHGRHSVGIDLNDQYLALAAQRLAQQSLFGEPNREGAV